MIKWHDALKEQNSAQHAAHRLRGGDKGCTKTYAPKQMCDCLHSRKIPADPGPDPKDCAGKKNTPQPFGVCRAGRALSMSWNSGVFRSVGNALVAEADGCLVDSCAPGPVVAAVRNSAS